MIVTCSTFMKKQNPTSLKTSYSKQQFINWKVLDSEVLTVYDLGQKR